MHSSPSFASPRWNCAVMSALSRWSLGLLVLFALLHSEQCVTASVLPVQPTGPKQAHELYMPLSDVLLRSMLDYNARHARPAYARLLLVPQPVDEEEADNEAAAAMDSPNGDGTIVLAKRKNAELVNHILKNFASLNRLGDAGK